MAHTHCIKKMLGIEDPNIYLDDMPVVFEETSKLKTSLSKGNYLTPRGVVRNAASQTIPTKISSRTGRSCPQ